MPARLRSDVVVRFLVIYDLPADPEAFERHYGDVHIPLAKQLPGLVRYTVGRNPKAVRGDAVYLVAALDWHDAAAMQEAFRSEIGQQTAQDVDNLAEPGRVRSMIFELEDV
jgi:uncharacterized protein (TIGR02118 family)